MNEIEKIIQTSRPHLSSQEKNILWGSISYHLAPRGTALSRKRVAIVSGTVALALFSSGVVTVYASTQSLPGDSLFPTKLVIERARVAVAITEEKRAQLRVEFANTRLEEVKILARERGIEVDDRDSHEADDNAFVASSTSEYRDEGRGSTTVSRGDGKRDRTENLDGSDDLFSGEGNIQHDVEKALAAVRDAQRDTKDEFSRGKLKSVEKKIIDIRKRSKRDKQPERIEVILEQRRTSPATGSKDDREGSRDDVQLESKSRGERENTFSPVEGEVNGTTTSSSEVSGGEVRGDGSRDDNSDGTSESGSSDSSGRGKGGGTSGRDD